MFLKKNHGPRTVMLSDGRVLSLADLPDTGTRWVASRKAVVVDAVNHGLISRDEAIRRYGLTEEEFAIVKQHLEIPVAIFVKYGSHLACLKLVQLRVRADWFPHIGIPHAE